MVPNSLLELVRRRICVRVRRRTICLQSSFGDRNIDASICQRSLCSIRNLMMA